MQSDLELASLLASRLCHDVVGPVGAIQNGLELIAEDESMTEMAMDLIRKSAAQATAKLQFARMAYGAAGGAEVLDPGEAGKLTAAMFAGERADLEWRWTGDAAPRVHIKIAMLLATFALGAVPRGGVVIVTREGDGTVTVAAEGNAIRTPQFTEIVTDGGEITDPRAVQAALIERLAASAGWRIAATASENALRFTSAAR